MSTRRLILSLFLTLVVAASGGLPPNGVLAGSPASTPPVATSAAEEIDLEVVRQAYDLLLDRYVYAPNPADLLAAAYASLGAVLTNDRGEKKAGTPPHFEQDRQVAWQQFEKEVRGLLSANPLPEELQLNAVLIQAMAESLDEGHTSYMSPEQYERHLAYVRGDARYEGIGMRPRRPGVTVAEVYPSSPAEEAGLLPGDTITAVDGEPTADKTLEEVAMLIRGPAGTSVQLEVHRPRTGERLTLSIVRASIKLEFVSTETIQDSVGYIRIRSFLDPTLPEIFERYLEQLPESGVRGLVIDLRGNPGGRVDIGLRILNQFFTSGPLFTQVERGGKSMVLSASGPGWKNPMPLAVLIDDGTASMGEIFAAAVRERGLARVIGKTSAGNVAAAIVVPLSDGSALQVTISEILSSKGERLNRVGVTPDHLLEPSQEDLDGGRDPQLEAAVLYVWDESDRAAVEAAAGATPGGR